MPSVAKAADRVPGPSASLRVEAGRGLVEEDELRVADEGEPEVETTQLPARECPHARSGALLEADELDHLADVPRARVVAGEEVERLAHRERRVHGGGLEHDSDARPKRCAAGFGIDAEDARLAAVAAPVALEDLDRRRLPGAVRAEEGEHLTCLDAEVEAVEHLPRAVRLPEVDDLDRRQRSRRIVSASIGPPRSSADVQTTSRYL